MALNHPDAARERAHLRDTLVRVRAEQAHARDQLEQAEAALALARRSDPDALPLREMQYAAAVQLSDHTARALKRPYFTRVDFTEQSGAKCRYYIGRYGVLDSGTLEPVVTDWRAPVANLYYSGQIGPMKYEAPDGAVQGELTLKRQFGIEDGQLQTIFDTDLASRDAYLQTVLGAMTGDRLREIVTTIQAEQNYVIRHPLDRTLVVQGVAGSGKTTIALHRIAYLLYAFGEKLRPEHMLILAPSPLFLNFISGVLPDLGVERVRQNTFAGFLSECLGSALPPCDLSDRLERVLRMDAETFERTRRVARTKGALSLGDRLDEWLDGFERRFAPEEGMAFGPVRLYDKAELDQFLLVDERPFPMQRRVAELKKQLSARARAAARRIEQWMLQESDRRAARIREEESDPVRVRKRLNALYASRDQRIAEAQAQVKPCVRALLEDLPSLEPMDLYRAFWQDMLKSANESLRLAARHTLSRLEARNPLEPEDLAPLALIALRVLELPRRDVRHIVVDEAQDFSPLEFRLLRRLAPGASMTIVGDLMQGVHAWRGLTDWRDLREGVFGGGAVMHHLVTSYRNTVEIMQVALRVARNRPVRGQKEAQPVLRHGEPPVFAAFADEAQQAGLASRFVGECRAAGLRAIALIDRSPERLRALLERLPPDLDAQLLDAAQEEYHAGVVLAPASAVKGLEFDAVILLDAGARAFPDSDMDARLLYVCLTRALHRLYVLHEGPLSTLLRETP